MEEKELEQAEETGAEVEQPEEAIPQQCRCQSASAAIGKFANPDALLSAYNALEAEFTKRCQKLKEAEAKLLAAETVVSAAPPSREDIANQLLTDEQFVEERVLSDEFIRAKVIERYLTDLSHPAVSVLTNKTGSAMLTPFAAPKTLAEAKKLADLFLKG